MTVHHHRRTRRRVVDPKKRLIIASALAALFVLALSSIVYADHLENHDAFCASCHSQPETTYYQRSLQAAQVDLASFHRTKDTRCIDCHSGEGLIGRLGAMQVGADDLIRWVTHTARQPAPLTVPIGDGNCLKCHTDVPNTQDFNLHFHAFLLRWQAVDPNAGGCVSCHSAHTLDGDPAVQFLNQNRTIQVCEACHAALGAGG
jgi:hypothetical protein